MACADHCQSCTHENMGHYLTLHGITDSCLNIWGTKQSHVKSKCCKNSYNQSHLQDFTALESRTKMFLYHKLDLGSYSLIQNCNQKLSRKTNSHIVAIK
jgi:hypothetical protein